MRRASGVAAVVLATVVLIVGVLILVLGIWLADPGGGESDYSTARNIRQLGLIAVGLGFAALALRDSVRKHHLARSALHSLLAVATWALWLFTLD